MLKFVEIKNFRNFPHFALDIKPGINILTGDNGVGKTNFLEAIYYLSRFESFRMVDDIDLIMHNKDYFYLKGVYRKDNIEVSYDGNKRIKKNGRVERKIGNLYAFIPVVSFTPLDTIIVSGSPENKRRFFDNAISSVSTIYINYLKRYTRALKQRNALLKAISEGKSKKEEINIWNEKLAHLGAELIKRRFDYIKRLEEKSKKVFRNFTKASLSLLYRTSINTDGDIEENLIKNLQAKFDKDLRFGYTNTGPHRDNIEILVDGYDAQKYISKGLQTIISFSIKIGESDLIKEVREESTIFLVDETVNELDKQNRDIFIKILEGFPQSFIATIEIEFAKSPAFNIFKLEKMYETTEIRQVN